MGKEYSKNSRKKMKVLLTLLLLTAYTSCHRTLFLAPEYMVRDLPSCVNDLKNDVSFIESAITNKDWTQVASLMKNVSKSYVDCKGAKNQVATCITDGKLIVSTLTSLFSLVKDRSMNPVSYINSIKSLISNWKEFTTDCYIIEPE